MVLYQSRSPLPGLRARLICPRFYTEVNGKRYEVDDKTGEQEQERLRVLAKLGKFQMN
jgi:hypothetical protein